MQTHSVAAAAVAATFLAGPLAHASEAAALPCPATTSATTCAEASRDPFRPEAQLRSVVENFLRYRVARVAIDGGCYAVLAFDPSGTPFEVKFRGNDLKMVSRYVVKGGPLDAPSSDQ
ncbi:MAG: PepSY domain-containing protein [Betaproteobacteria bacterium]